MVGVGTAHNGRMPRAESDDPTVQLWHKVRRPLLGLVFLVLVLGQVPRLLSGEPFPTVTAALLVAFWTWLVWRPLFPEGDKTTPEYWRSWNRSAARWWGLWLFVAAGWLTWGSVIYGFNPPGLLVLALPSLGLLASWFGYAKAERLAEAQAENHPPSR
jgi:hypothetical protein